MASYAVPNRELLLLKLRGVMHRKGCQQAKSNLGRKSNPGLLLLGEDLVVEEIADVADFYIVDTVKRVQGMRRVIPHGRIRSWMAIWLFRASLGSQHLSRANSFQKYLNVWVFVTTNPSI